MIRSTTAAAAIAVILSSTTGVKAFTGKAAVGSRGTFAGSARCTPVKTSPVCRPSHRRCGIGTTTTSTSLRMYVSAPTADFYEVLGVSRAADVSEIKRAYRNLAKQYHPDANTYKGRNTSEKFKEICEAYEVLSNDEARSRYDGRCAAASSHRASRSPFGGFGHHVADGFDSFFRGNPGAGARRGATGPSRSVDGFDSFFRGNPGAGTGAGAGAGRRATGSSRSGSGVGAGAPGREVSEVWRDFSGVGVGAAGRGGAGTWTGSGAGSTRGSSGVRSGAGTGAAGRGSAATWDFSGVGVGGGGAGRGGPRAARWGSSANAGRRTSETQKTARAAGAERCSAGAWDFGGFGVGSTEGKSSGAQEQSTSSSAGREATGAKSNAEVSERRPSIPEDGDDVQFDLEVNFQTAVLGGDEIVRVRHLETCKDGADKGCRTSRMKSIKITIPPGIESGTMLRVRGEGDVGLNGGSAGDLYISVKVKQDEGKRFRKEGPDIYSNVTINYVDAVIGSSIRIPVVDGEATLNVPPGTQPGEVIRLQGNGGPLLGIKGSRGDHVVTVIVDIPRNISKEERALLNKVNDLMGGSKNEIKQSSAAGCEFCDGTSKKNARNTRKKKTVESPAQQVHHQTVSKLLGKEKYTVKHLKAALRERGLKVSGLKADLMERLHVAVCTPAATIPAEEPKLEQKLPFLNKISQKAIDKLLMEIRQHV